MDSSVGGRLWRCGAFLAWLPIAAAASAAASDPPGSPPPPAGGASPGAEIVGDTLVIEGTPENDRILIRATRQPDTVRVTFDGQSLGPFGPVARVAVRAGDGDDTVLVSAAVELPVRIDAGPGDDRLRGGAGPDLVFGEGGDDVLFTSLGRDALDGGPGSNRLVLGRPMGEIQVGSSAAGDAPRILAKAYDLRPLADPSAAEPGPLLVGPAELQNDDTVELLRTAYRAGHAIALAGAEAADAELLRGLLGHASGGRWHADIPQADLVAFRRAPRPDGRTHEKTSIMLPREAVEGLSPAEARRGGRAADLLALERLSKVFSGTPVVPDLASAGDGACANVPPDQCLQTLADSYQSSVVQQNTSGDQVQTVNSAWALRSFVNQKDLYYVLQEVDYHVGTINSLGVLFGWFESATNTLLDESPAPTTIQTSPATTMSTTSVTSGVSESVGGAAGWNQMQGLNATLTGGVTISNSTTVEIPPIQITNDTDLETGVAAWIYEVSDPDRITRPETITFYNQWIWEVLFTTYDTEQENIVFHSSSVQSINDGPNGTRGLKADLNSPVPLPFGDTFALQPPVVTSVVPDDVCAGDEFTIAGTGLYPTLVQAVLIDGGALDPSAFSIVSDTEITVVAPDTLGFALPVAVRTGVALSNADVTIAIDPLCAPAATSAPAPAQSAAAGTAP